MSILRIFFFTALLAFASVAHSASSKEMAAAIFTQYQSLAAAFDPAVADLYSDNAVITNKRTYPNGEVKALSLPAKQYKELVRAAMPVAKARGDISTYTDIVYAVEGDNVRITATRFSELKKYSSKLVLVVGPNEKGDWQVCEEHSESRP